MMHLCREVCCIYVLLLWVDLVYVQTSGLQAQSTVSHISRTQQSSEGGSNDTTGSVSTGSRLSEGQVTPQPGAAESGFPPAFTPITDDSYYHSHSKPSALEQWVIPLGASVGAIVVAAFLTAMICAARKRNNRRNTTNRQIDQHNFPPAYMRPATQYSPYSMYPDQPSGIGESHDSVVLSVSGPPDLSETPSTTAGLHPNRPIRGRFLTRHRFRRGSRSRRRPYIGRFSRHRKH